MADGQRLHWWQEQEGQSGESKRASERVALAAECLLPETKATPAVETVSLAEEYSDTWEDLEAEALRRAELAKLEEAESISFYLDKPAALVRHRREIRPLWWFLGIVVAMCVLLPVVLYLAEPHQHHSFPNIGAFGGFIAIFMMHFRRQQWLQNHEKPSVRIAPEGLFLHTSLYSDITLPWNEIVEIKPKGSRKKRCLEIRATRRRRFLISEQDLPITAEALATRIAIYETGRGIA